MYYIMEFLSRDNNTLLVKLLTQQGHSINNELLDNCMFRINHECDKYNNNIVLMNKQVLQEYIINNSRKPTIDNIYQTKKEEFENMINKKVPDKPSFLQSDKESPLENSEYLYDKSLADRQKDLENIMKKNNKTMKQAEKWIKNEEPQIDKMEPTNKKINIDFSSNIDIKPKKVSFNDKPIEIPSPKKDFFKKLKKINVDDDLQLQVKSMQVEITQLKKLIMSLEERVNIIETKK